MSFFFLKKKRWFTYWYVFSNSLFYSSLITVGSVDIKPYFISTLFMFFGFVRGDLFSKNSFKNKDVAALFLFLAWIVLTFPLSIFLKNINVIPSDSQQSDVEVLHPINAKIGSIIYTLNPAFNIFSFVVVRAYIKTSQDIKDFTKGYLLSYIPLVITVIILFIFRNVIHTPALTEAFFSFINPTYKRNVSANTWGSIGDIARTFTYVGEASFTAKYYLMMMSLFAGMLLYQKNSIQKKVLLLFNLLLILILITLLGSTTGYVGFFILLGIIGVLYLGYQHTIRASIVNSNSRFIFTFLIFSLFVLIPSVMLFYDQIVFFWNYLLVNHIDKIEGEAGSGYVRIQSNLIALEAFFKSPLFGVGYGHNRATTFLSFLLSNVGIVGFILFNFFWFYLVFVPLRKLKNMPQDLKMHCIVYVTMFIITYLTNFLFSSSVAIAFGWVWTNAALLSRLADWRNLEDYSQLELI